MSALLKVMLCAFAALIPSALTVNAAIQTADLAIAIPSDEPGFIPMIPRLQAIAIFAMAWKVDAITSLLLERTGFA
jgi:hypothetical protein